MSHADSQIIENKFRKDLLLARKERDVLKTEVLQTILVAIDNSTAVSTVGTRGLTEVPRRQVSVEDIRNIIKKEILEVHTAMDVFRKSNQSPPSELNDRLSLLRTYLRSVDSF